MFIDTNDVGRKAPKTKAFRSSPEVVRDTSIAAFESHDEATTREEDKIYCFVRNAGGATCYEVEQALKMLHQTASARIAHLSAKGWLRDTGERRPTGTGRKAIVWGVA